MNEQIASEVSPKNTTVESAAHGGKDQVVSQPTPSTVRSIADAIVLKQSNLFFLSRRNGSVPVGERHGFGLYYNDCRFLDGYTIALGNTRPTTLVSNASDGNRAVLQLSNEEFPGLDGKLIAKETLGIKWNRALDGSRLTLDDTLVFQNFSLEKVAFEVSFAFDATFEDVFAVRGFMRGSHARRSAHWNDEVLSFRYEGADKVHRSVDIHFAPCPHADSPGAVTYRVELGPKATKEISVTIALHESLEAPVGRPTRPKARENEGQGTWLSEWADISTDSISLNRTLARSFGDLQMLESEHGGRGFFAAGVPWFATLFGRDSLITALQTLAYAPGIAEQTLRLLAHYQGTRFDAWKEEAPGKILHEVRFGELARLGEIPHTPYFGTIDATPLFLVLLARHAQWTGSLALFRELKDNVERALSFMAEYGDLEGDGYLKYNCISEKGLANQGWKDSWDGIVNEDGSISAPPIALVEVQGYLYEAKVAIAELFERDGNGEKASLLRQQAAALRESFNRDFWVEEKQFLALALQAKNQPASVISSNPGHALWSGILENEKAKKVASRLLEADMFSGWGIRTLSTKESRYNPLGYHLGTVWPHDNSVIAAGCKRYGLEGAVQQIFDGMFRSTLYFDNQSLPELFAGFSEADYGVPVHYPVACHPQAWAAGTIPHLLESLLGLVPDAFAKRLRIVRPQLPPIIDQLEFRNLRLGEAQVDLGFYRTDRKIAVEVLRSAGPVEVIVEPMP